MPGSVDTSGNTWFVGAQPICGKCIDVKCPDGTVIHGIAVKKRERRGGYQLRHTIYGMYAIIELTGEMVMGLHSSEGSEVDYKAGTQTLTYDREGLAFSLGDHVLATGDTVLVKTHDNKVRTASVEIARKWCGPEYSRFEYGHIQVRVAFHNGDADHVITPEIGQKLVLVPPADQDDTQPND
jgi:hypothetical protein